MVKSVVYSVPVTKANPGETSVYRNVSSPEELYLRPADGVTTMQDVYIRSAKEFAAKPFLGKRNPSTRTFDFITYAEAFERGKRLGTALIKRQLLTKSDDYKDYQMELIGIFSINREEWIILDIANCLYNFTMIPFYETLGLEALEHTLEESNLRVLLTTEVGWLALRKLNNYHSLETLILLDAMESKDFQDMEAKGLKHIFYRDLMKEDKSIKSEPFRTVKPEDVYSFCYTSGTTGKNKAVMMTHQSVVAMFCMAEDEQYTPDDTYLSYLPLAHTLERCFMCNLAHLGARAGFYQGDVFKIRDDLQVLKPDFFLSVPRLYNKIYDAIQERLAQLSGFKKSLQQFAFNQKLKAYEKLGRTRHCVWDKLVFAKSKAALGGRCRGAGVGSAPISPDKGYGSTECNGAAFFTKVEDNNVESVGGPQRNVEFKLIDCPELEYYTTSKTESKALVARGEICLRGNSVFKDYFKNEEYYKQTVDADNWLHTGDIGELNLKTGALRIIDRISSIFKLSIGEFIKASDIESKYSYDPLVEELFIYAEGTKNYIVAVVVPKEEAIKAIAKKEGLSLSFAELCAQRSIKNAVLKSMQETGKQQGLQRFEIVKAIYLEHRNFKSLDLVSTTLKISRRKAIKFYDKQLKDLCMTS